ncbi:MAG TPA: GrpB family protein, partial [Ktedonobacteraceae bacterium]|nr:GrpB family protein [Ktedonobacteraceae bacterium]
GEMTDGGIVEQVQHVGATSVPGLLGQACVDISLSVWPFPLEERARHALASLGYELDPDFAGAPEQRFRHASTAFRLYIVEAGSTLWTDYVLIREYLRHDEPALQSLSACKQGWEGDTGSTGYREAKRQWFDQHLADAHRSWIEREGFAPLHRLVEELRDFTGLWYICGGWALDAFLGRVTRVHHDVDVVMSRADQLALQQYMTARGWKLITPFEGQLQPWPMHMRLELPRHQIHAHRSGAFIDFQITDVDSGIWRYRREPSIIRDMSRAGLRSEEGIPLLAPELVLLFKSKNTTGRERSKDLTDFEKVYTSLEPERRAWLRWALTATDPSHPWIERL